MIIKALLLMSGKGERFGRELPKQFYPLCGKKIYLHSVETLASSNLFDEIILVCPKGWVELVSEEVESFPNIRVIAGGKTRQKSSYLGLLACGPTDVVLIHDAVRCFASTSLLKRSLDAAAEHKAANSCIPCTDTLAISKDGKSIDDIPLRSEYYLAQTPQSFEYSLIKRAHELAIKNRQTNISDDCRLVQQLGHEVYIVQGEETNIKITTAQDLMFGENILKK